jgi:hypothetical protein
MNIDNHEHDEFQPGEKLRETTDRRKSVQVTKAYLCSSGAHSAFLIFGSVSAICNAVRTVKVELDARLVKGLSLIIRVYLKNSFILHRPLTHHTLALQLPLSRLAFA